MSILKEISEQAKLHIEDAIAKAELKISAEIRVHLEQSCKENVMDRAAFIFSKLEMHKTEQRNGILIYAAFGNRKLAIIGDAGINQYLKQEDWDYIKDSILSEFRQGNIEAGLIMGVQLAGEKLHRFFPILPNDINELPNKVTTEKDV